MSPVMLFSSSEGYRSSVALDTSGISRTSSPLLALRDKPGPSERVTPASPTFCFFRSCFSPSYSHFILFVRLVIYPGQQLGSHRSEHRAIVPSPRPNTTMNSVSPSVLFAI
ncbi:hypothetical protein N7491_002189 [Penicillium cf. griseofulvum]|uniref:Uncharacterized protein n=1 Tax=Penicillium cf. griseofulvum TaxID=2972120 RepID=A0A9W9MTN9_9EURO|nr:hypothetical protein N7472_003628 [Penicillium cf. griseofulvum]KAJ5446107.1 hypothetical protein N7491_002189 [Penicillium cf. griseofulvum]KAJ5447847.1 hypothetical protein N7445_002668 [Penicillium cf. griseofulvum]